MADGGAQRFTDLGTEAYWRRHFPKLSIGQRLTPALRDRILTRRARDDEIALLDERMAVDGYIQGRDNTLAKNAPLLAAAVKTCKALEVPPTFLFVFDEVWECFYSLNAMLSHFLGDYRLLPDFWVWHVDPSHEEAGWAPHRDKGRVSLGPDGRPLSLTVWIPLSVATPLTSCMYVLPKGRDPVYGTEQEYEFQIDPPAVRALPGGPGDWFCWNQALLHWGSVSSRFADQPRISMALELQRADVKPFNQPLLPPFSSLDFPSRLLLIAKQILQYRHMYRVHPDIEAYAQSILRKSA